MVKLFRWIFGYVRFSFSNGFREGFLNECFETGIPLRDVELTENGFVAACNVRVYMTLHKIALRHGGVVRVQKKSGLPFIILPLRNRLGFFGGALAFVMILSFLGSFIWNIEIVGCEELSESVIEAYLENNNLCTGTLWSSVNRDKLCWQMMRDFDDISWVHINKSGTTARIEINETVKSPTGDEDKLRGVDVYRRELQAVAYREQKDIVIKDCNTYRRLIFFSVKIPLYFERKTGDISEYSEKYLNIHNTYLPVGIEEDTEKYLTSSTKTLSDDEVTELARKKLSFIERDELDGFEIINKNEEIALDDDKCVITTAYIVRRK